MTTDLKASDEDLNLVFSALSDPTRRSILERLSRGEASVGELAAPFAMSLPALSTHLGALWPAGLWNMDGVDEDYDPAVLDFMAAHVEAAH